MDKFKNKKTIFQLFYNLKKDEIFALASQLSYSLLLSFFPFLIFLFTIASYSSIQSDRILFTLKNIIPESAYTLVYSIINEVLQSRNANLLSFSFIITIWIASNGFKAVIRALNKAYGEKEERSFIKLQFMAIITTIILTFLIIFSLFILVLGNLIGYKIMTFFSLPDNLFFIWNVFRYFLMLIFMILIFAVIYKLTPCRKLTFGEVLPGSIFATIGWIIVSIGFSFYVDNFANYSRLYGSIGAVIILMIWLFLTSIIILIGGEINALLLKR
ncbi:YihY/virulence factor BrkB family protein [Clostridium botulinum C]|uniref:YihY/virulence factor BrkB family protein n=1 Tax=Clostridium TaxID=1485 RepID=UPI000EA28610|nr:MULTISPECIES: YihY/virulence factor BrkB family protein [Clostridium]AYF53424.1 YihY/virulence factor BrkB family protein [Clostridium novyi]MCD3217527.1 YihY/virulence factor BrkB family protein [Clostridium botulinum C]MCD3246260.1 YihY/virulence factor BrkB family protein [Clostridium botulinum C]MCD3260696.1 YihY/virulence factor BrkB family protein [Clostridium botulinum C]